MESPRTILILGATGHIGRAIALACLHRGDHVRGLARGSSATTRSLPGITWHYGDMAKMTAADAWRDLTAGCHAVVNAAGALQDGARDDLAAIHHQAVSALVAAMPPTSVLLQISAPGASPESPTAFYRTKAAGDAAVCQSGKPFVILRPTVVVSPEAYGGTALLRALAALPLAIPAVNPQSLMQTVALSDVVAATLDAIDGRVPPGSDLILAEPTAQTLSDVLNAFRAWLGLVEAPVLAVPSWLAHLTAFGADLAGHLGWRSPLRSTALAVAAEDVVGTPGYPCRPLGQTLTEMPATVQDRWFARLYLLKAAGILVLSLFWLFSGAVGLARLDAATMLLLNHGFSPMAAAVFVTLGSFADLALGSLLLVRRHAAKALIGMLALTAAYVAASLIFTPGLWLDPLGPMAKAIPAGLAALLLLAIEPER